MTLAVSNLNPSNSLNLNSSTNALVSNAEMLQIANDILASAPKTQPVGLDNSFAQVSFGALNKDNTVKVFGIDSADAQTVRQIANNRANYDVSLSQETLSAIESLKSKAASTTSLFNNMDGKVYIPTETPNTDRTKSIFAADNQMNIFSASDSDKDKRGSNPFSLAGVKKESQKQEKELNIFA